MLTLTDFEVFAEKHLNKRAWNFFSMGAEKEETFRDNIRSFNRYHLVQRVLRSAPVRDMSVTVLGEKLPLPFGIAPSAYQKLAHPDGELAAAKAASEVGSIYTLSTVSTTPLEDVARVVHGSSSPLWMQVYVLKKRKFTEAMIRKAEACGYKALVLTVDTPTKGLQYKSWRDPLKLPDHLSLCNIEDVLNSKNYYERYFENLFEENLTWDDIKWLKSISSLPIVLKGITTKEDAIQAAEMGAAGVWISNHGGRSVDGLEAAIDVLPSISSALSGTGCEVYVDGGVRWGSDVFKALALGASYVFIGRPALWGLAHSGKDGVRQILEILKFELDRTMQLMGCQNIQDIRPHLLKKNLHCRL